MSAALPRQCARAVSKISTVRSLLRAAAADAAAPARAAAGGPPAPGGGAKEEEEEACVKEAGRKADGLRHSAPMGRISSRVATATLGLTCRIIRWDRSCSTHVHAARHCSRDGTAAAAARGALTMHELAEPEAAAASRAARCLRTICTSAASRAARSTARCSRTISWKSRPLPIGGNLPSSLPIGVVFEASPWPPLPREGVGGTAEACEPSVVPASGIGASSGAWPSACATGSPPRPRPSPWPPRPRPPRPRPPPRSAASASPAASARGPSSSSSSVSWEFWPLWNRHLLVSQSSQSSWLRS